MSWPRTCGRSSPTCRVADPGALPGHDEPRSGVKRDRFKTTGQKGDTVSAPVLCMSVIRELWEALHGS
jgi:hypothetical protein